MTVLEDRLTNNSSATYRILIAGSIQDSWEEWFGGMRILCQHSAGRSPITSLTGVVQDQARLRGILNKLWDLNLVIISVNRMDEEELCWI
jgi:hypothetical protein